jgi:hypothetical protein
LEQINLDFRFVCGTIKSARGERLDLQSVTNGGDAMTASEVMELLTLLAVVIFGVLNAANKK